MRKPTSSPFTSTPLACFFALAMAACATDGTDADDGAGAASGGGSGGSAGVGGAAGAGGSGGSTAGSAGQAGSSAGSAGASGSSGSAGAGGGSGSAGASGMGGASGSAGAGAAGGSAGSGGGGQGGAGMGGAAGSAGMGGSGGAAGSSGAGGSCMGTDPRYGDVECLSDTALRVGLLQKVNGHTSLGYNGARSWLYGQSGIIDPVNGQIEGVYTGRLVMPDGTNIPGGFNTEHTWPTSEGVSGDTARSDLHQIFPCDQTANNLRASHPYGETNCGQMGASACGFSDGGSRLGPATNGSGTVFDVRPEMRGDIARAHFYYAVRYGLNIDATEEAVLRAWHAADPPSMRETNRMETIAGLQNNRNPFIDRPDFVGKISDF